MENYKSSLTQPVAFFGSNINFLRGQTTKMKKIAHKSLASLAVGTETSNSAKNLVIEQAKVLCEDYIYNRLANILHSQNLQENTPLSPPLADALFQQPFIIQNENLSSRFFQEDNSEQKNTSIESENNNLFNNIHDSLNNQEDKIPSLILDDTSFDKCNKSQTHGIMNETTSLIDVLPNTKNNEINTYNDETSLNIDIFNNPSNDTNKYPDYSSHSTISNYIEDGTVLSKNSIINKLKIIDYTTEKENMDKIKENYNDNSKKLPDLTDSKLPEQSVNYLNEQKIDIHQIIKNQDELQKYLIYLNADEIAKDLDNRFERSIQKILDDHISNDILYSQNKKDSLSINHETLDSRNLKFENDAINNENKLNLHLNDDLPLQLYNNISTYENFSRIDKYSLNIMSLFETDPKTIKTSSVDIPITYVLPELETANHKKLPIRKPEINITSLEISSPNSKVRTISCLEIKQSNLEDNGNNIVPDDDSEVKNYLLLKKPSLQTCKKSNESHKHHILNKKKMSFVNISADFSIKHQHKKSFDILSLNTTQNNITNLIDQELFKNHITKSVAISEIANEYDDDDDDYNQFDDDAYSDSDKSDSSDNVLATNFETISFNTPIYSNNKTLVIGDNDDLLKDFHTGTSVNTKNKDHLSYDSGYNSNNFDTNMIELSSSTLLQDSANNSFFNSSYCRTELYMKDSINSIVSKVSSINDDISMLSNEKALNNFVESFSSSESALKSSIENINNRLIYSNIENKTIAKDTNYQSGDLNLLNSPQIMVSSNLSLKNEELTSLPILKMSLDYANLFNSTSKIIANKDNILSSRTSPFFNRAISETNVEDIFNMSEKFVNKRTLLTRQASTAVTNPSIFKERKLKRQMSFLGLKNKYDTPQQSGCNSSQIHTSEINTSLSIEDLFQPNYTNFKEDDLLGQLLFEKWKNNLPTVSYEIQSLGSKLEQAYPHLFDDLSAQLKMPLRSEMAVIKAMTFIGDYMFRNSVITWYRIIAMMAVAGSIALETVDNDKSHLISHVVDVFSQIIERHAAFWICKQGGWRGILPKTEKDEDKFSLAFTVLGIACGFIIITFLLILLKKTY